MTLILGIDPGYASGAYVILDNRKPIHWHSWDGDSDGTVFERSLEINNALYLLAATYNIQAAGYEEFFSSPPPKNQPRRNLSAANYGRGVLDGIFQYTINKPICWIHPKTLKKWVTGNGNAKKTTMMSHLRSYYEENQPEFYEKARKECKGREIEHLLEAGAIGEMTHCLWNSQYTSLPLPPSRIEMLRAYERKKPWTNMSRVKG